MALWKSDSFLLNRSVPCVFRVLFITLTEEWFSCFLTPLSSAQPIQLWDRFYSFLCITKSQIPGPVIPALVSWRQQAHTHATKYIICPAWPLFLVTMHTKRSKLDFLILSSVSQAGSWGPEDKETVTNSCADLTLHPEQVTFMLSTTLEKT